MWLFTRFGFFSVVVDPTIKPERNAHGVTAHYNIAIRARVRKDLLLLLELPTGLRAAQPEIVEIPNRDYPYRIYASREELQDIMLCLANDLDYSNFKSMIDEAPGQGQDRHDLYMQVWTVMHRAEEKLLDMAAKAKARLAQPFLGDDDRFEGWFSGRTLPPKVVPARMKSAHPPKKAPNKGKA